MSQSKRERRVKSSDPASCHTPTYPANHQIWSRSRANLRNWKYVYAFIHQSDAKNGSRFTEMMKLILQSSSERSNDAKKQVDIFDQLSTEWQFVFGVIMCGRLQHLLSIHLTFLDESPCFKCFHLFHFCWAQNIKVHNPSLLSQAKSSRQSGVHHLPWPDGAVFVMRMQTCISWMFCCDFILQTPHCPKQTCLQSHKVLFYIKTTVRFVWSSY